MNDNMSLIAILNSDPEFGRRISKKVDEIKEDKENLMALADSYGKKYEDEIMAGTEQRSKLIAEGESKGLSEEQVISNYNKFLPTVWTPLLNMLYFMLRETEEEDRMKYRQRDRLNEQFGHLREDDFKSQVLKEPTPMIEYLYGHTTLEKFNIIKKLKALSTSDNESEAFQAYRKARELCKEEGLDFDKIPCYVGEKKVK